MAIPLIAPYEVPEVREAPRVDWVPDPARCAVLVHDMQEYFLRAYDREAEPARSVLAHIAEIVRCARAAGVPVIYSVQPGDQHPLRRGLLADLWGPGMRPGPDTEVVAALTPEPGDVVLTKWRYSAFRRTDLREVLARAGRDQLVVTGVYAHMGCQVTSVDAFMDDVQPFLIRDAVADFSAEEHAGAVDYVAKRCGRVLDTAELLVTLATPVTTWENTGLQPRK